MDDNLISRQGDKTTGTYMGLLLCLYKPETLLVEARQPQYSEAGLAQKSGYLRGISYVYLSSV